MGHSKPIIPVDKFTTLLTFRKAFIIFGSMEDTGPHSLACISDHTNIKFCKSHLVKIAKLLLSVEKKGKNKGEEDNRYCTRKGYKDARKWN